MSTTCRSLPPLINCKKPTTMKDLLASLFDNNEEFVGLGKETLVEVFCRGCGATVKINENYAKHIDAVDSCKGCRR